MKSKFLTLFNVHFLLWLALALALAGSLRHLAATYASIDNNHFFGVVQAIAIDCGLFALAFSIRQRKTAKRTIKPLWVGLVIFTGISIYGNLSFGLFATTGTLPVWIAVSRPYVLAGSLPILVLFLSELLSDDRQHAQKEAAKEAKRATHASKIEELHIKNAMPIEDARIAKQARIATRRQHVARLAGEGLHPAAILNAIGGQYNIKDVRTIKTDLQTVAINGNGNGNGNGVK